MIEMLVMAISIIMAIGFCICMICMKHIYKLYYIVQHHSSSINKIVHWINHKAVAKDDLNLIAIEELTPSLSIEQEKYEEAIKKQKKKPDLRIVKK